MALVAGGGQEKARQQNWRDSPYEIGAIGPGGHESGVSGFRSWKCAKANHDAIDCDAGAEMAVMFSDPSKSDSSPRSAIEHVLSVGDVVQVVALVVQAVAVFMVRLQA